ncbi:hypothetical protein CEUSTIGMA_g2246.t1 [Chlamydomonas eustigma]|uniref:uroporphyrinogen-III C-methyltransferase n=1 Tax=Chlamydomonas eustigma TaxID=1157962 RepID=A0A250WVR8_9CHLO|nr:hypothetical protein CEUSTIGMA_g2246.t1 [Chlamydomonas eustigma]|eukprot:GAX74799.1 hypothetical protein CEUSTIGMA_g2246.t1 [Chlamydomonas eustigma]
MRGLNADRSCPVSRKNAPSWKGSVMICSASSKCWLVGGGLGPADYLTLKAVKLIQEADVLVYDDLGTQDALQLAKEDCEKFYVGKRGGRESIKQTQIDELLVQACLKGSDRSIVRLKGGDPAVYSRATSEIAALTAAGIPYEFVPGISSVLAAPLLAGFPLTDVNVGSSFAVVSGHNVEGTNWQAFSDIPTLVILMAGKNLAVIAQKMAEVHRMWTKSTPVVVIRDAGLPNQREWRSTLQNIAEETQGEQLSPCIVIIGQVAGLYC